MNLRTVGRALDVTLTEPKDTCTHHHNNNNTQEEAESPETQDGGVGGYGSEESE